MECKRRPEVHRDTHCKIVTALLYCSVGLCAQWPNTLRGHITVTDNNHAFIADWTLTVVLNASVMDIIVCRNYLLRILPA